MHARFRSYQSFRMIFQVKVMSWYILITKGGLVITVGSSWLCSSSIIPSQYPRRKPRCYWTGHQHPIPFSFDICNTSSCRVRNSARRVHPRAPNATHLGRFSVWIRSIRLSWFSRCHCDELDEGILVADGIRQLFNALNGRTNAEIEGESPWFEVCSF